MKTFNKMIDFPIEGELQEIGMEVLAVLGRDDFKGYDIYNDDLDVLLGGPICIVETLDDLMEVTGLDSESNPVSIMLMVPTFDIVRILPSERWVMFFSVVTNAGGPSYYVPRAIADQVPNINRALQEHNGDRPLVQSERGQLFEYSRVSPISCALTKRMVPLSPEQYAKYHRGEEYFDEVITEAEETFITTGVTEDDVATVGELYT